MERRRSWVAMPFPGSAHVAAGPRYPPTLGTRVRRAGALREGSFARRERETSTGAGAEARWWSQGDNPGVKDCWFYGGKVRNIALGTGPGPDGSPVGSPGGLRRSPGELLGAPGSPKVI